MRCGEAARAVPDDGRRAVPSGRCPTPRRVASAVRTVVDSGERGGLLVASGRGRVGGRMRRRRWPGRGCRLAIQWRLVPLLVLAWALVATPLHPPRRWRPRTGDGVCCRSAVAKADPETGSLCLGGGVGHGGDEEAARASVSDGDPSAGCRDPQPQWERWRWRPLLGTAEAQALTPTAEETFKEIDLFRAPSNDEAAGIAIDGAGDYYVTGKSKPQAGTVGGGIAQGFSSGVVVGSRVNAGMNDVWVAKVSAAGNVVWLRSYGTSADDIPRGIAVDDTGSVYVGGHTRGDLSTTGGRNKGQLDYFLSRLSAQTGALVWTVQNGTIGRDALTGLVSANGAIYATGQVGAEFITTPSDGSDVVVLSYSSSGALNWAVQRGVAKYSIGSSIAVSPADGSLYVGITAYRAVPGDQETSDFAVMRVAGATGEVLWTTQTTSFSQVFVQSIVVDSVGSAYVAAADWKHVYQNFNFFLRKYSATGDELWLQDITTEGSHADYPTVVLLSANEKEVYVTGYTSGILKGSVSNGGAVSTGREEPLGQFTSVLMRYSAAKGVPNVLFQTLATSSDEWIQIRAAVADADDNIVVAGYRTVEGSTVNAMLGTFKFRPSDAVVDGEGVGNGGTDSGGGGSTGGDGGDGGDGGGEDASEEGGGLPISIVAGAAGGGLALVVVVLVGVAYTLRTQSRKRLARRESISAAASERLYGLTVPAGSRAPGTPPAARPSLGGGAPPTAWLPPSRPASPTVAGGTLPRNPVAGQGGPA